MIHAGLYPTEKVEQWRKFEFVAKFRSGQGVDQLLHYLFPMLLEYAIGFHSLILHI